ncbi:zinc finger protein ubi-d4 [Tetranychus urticae]|uniref:Zinc finger protein DPF3 n=1 Tax=Tetranychus urticae TaxID=32264 RepID=T1KQA8_TETUR|nr:zinc finger protein ubi-d4 [Tetranychus urticae]
MSNLRPKILQKIEKALNEMSYRDAIENSSKYNNQLVGDRKTRLPFIDAQTGVAQKDCYLWMKKWQRMPGTNYGQLYTYPSNSWKKKRRGYLLNQPYMCRDRTNEFSDKKESFANGTDASQSRPEQSENSSDKFVDNSKDAWVYADYEDSIDLIEGDFEDPNSDGDDYDEFTVKRRRRRKETTRRRRGQSDLQDADKPYACDLCDARYKTRPGLTYHYAHSHVNSTDGDKPSKSSTPVSIIDDEENSRSMPGTHNHSGNNSNQGSANDTQEQSSSTAKGKNSAAAPSPYCDFCLGDSEENKKSRSREKMVSCSDCGRSAHPTCLQFTPQMILSVQKYRWQCIECKSCGLCGTSDNDEQLLFCDDCDRGYHMFCLNPPLSEPPEGSWSCHLCIEEYHKPQTKSEIPEEANKKVEKEEKTTSTNDVEVKKREKEDKSREKDKPDGEEKIKNDVEKQQDGSTKLVKASNNVNEPNKAGSKDELIKVIQEEPRKQSQSENKESKEKDKNKESEDSSKKSEKLDESSPNPPKKA